MGELLNQGKNNLQAPWLGHDRFFHHRDHAQRFWCSSAKAVRDAFDPRKLFASETPIVEDNAAIRIKPSETEASADVPLPAKAVGEND